MPRMNEPDTARAIARKFYESYSFPQDLEDGFRRYVSPDVKNHALGGAYDREEWRSADGALFSAFADFGIPSSERTAV